MGGPIARHLLSAGVSVSVYDPEPEAVARLAALGAVSCATAVEAAEAVDLILVVVVDDEQVRDAVAACFDGARSGTVIAICASVRPDTCRTLAREGTERGLHVIDVALVRGERGAEEGRLVLFCGGTPEIVDRIRPVCSAFAEAILHVGDVGAGQIAKTANNILLWACIRADVEAQRLARALGVEPAKLRDALALGSGANRPLEEWGAHRLRWPAKDLEVALAVAAEAGVEMPLVEQLPRLMSELSVDDLQELL